MKYISRMVVVDATRASDGDTWIVNERGVTSKMTDAEFNARYVAAVESDDDDDGGRWMVYDTAKPISMLSVYDHVFLEVMKARVARGEDIGEVIADNINITDEALSAMGYDV